MRVLVVEDGFEYIELCQRFGSDLACWTRKNCGADALTWIGEGHADAILLDVCFRRLQSQHWMSPVVGHEHLVDDIGGEQGVVILQHLREMGSSVPVLLAMRTANESARWAELQRRYDPVLPLGQRLHPASVVARLASMIPSSP